jgi:hypothetical protein
LATLSAALYLASLALLPWGWFPPFPWLHEHAQWSDLLFAGAAAVWAVEGWRRGELPRLRLLHAALAAYLAASALSLLFASPRPPAGVAKLLGMGELVALLVVTSDLASRAPVSGPMARVTSVTAILAAAAALLGEILFLVGVANPLVGGYGDLEPGQYARVQAGMTHPNLLASFCVFAWGVTTRQDAALSPRRLAVTRAALLLAAGLTFSRGILALLLAILVARATTPARRRAALAFACAAIVVIVAIAARPLRLEPTRPLEARWGSGVSSRAEAFVSSLESLRARPWTGVGPGASPGRHEGHPFDAHFTPLNVAATLGLPALAALVAIPLLLWRQRSRPTDLAVWGALAGMGLDALSQDVEDFRHLWILFGLADAGRRGGDPKIS